MHICKRVLKPCATLGFQNKYRKMDALGSNANNQAPAAYHRAAHKLIIALVCFYWHHPLKFGGEVRGVCMSCVCMYILKILLPFVRGLEPIPETQN